LQVVLTTLAGGADYTLAGGADYTLAGGADYSQLLPAGSYVDALTQSPANLAHFIKYLDSNQSVFKTYFQVRGTFL
jgi:hypothetical protein